MEVVVDSSHFVSASPSSSHSSPAPAWGPSHGRQFSINFSNVSPSHGLQLFTNRPSVGPFHGVQSFRNRLLQRESPTGSQALPANLLWRGLLSPRVRRSWQEPAPAWAIHGVTASLWHPPAPAWGPPQAAGGDLLHCGPPRTAGDSLPHHGLHHRLHQGNLCSSACSTSSPSSSLTLVSAELFLSLIITPLSCSRCFFPA